MCNQGTKLTVQMGRHNYRTMKQTLNMKRLACHNLQTGLDNATGIEKIYYPPTCWLA